jgi:hypothetical protein
MKISSDHLKWALVIVAGGYIYLKWREGKDDGKIAGFEMNPDLMVDSIMPWLQINPVVKPLVHGATKSFLRNYSGHYKNGAIEAEYKRV